MPDFSLKTTWRIPAPIALVWDSLIHTETWPDWWRYVASVTELEPGLPDGLANTRSYCWRTALPYDLHLEMTVIRLVPCRTITVAVSGDLTGTGQCTFSVEAETEVTCVEFYWQVQTCKPWMNRLSILTRPVFEWNHAEVMKQGESGLIAYLGIR
ncbi:MAG: polyketide cyclase / dehydrase and lipid transport [Gammaproteobacteria bacterium HGW-Gammaproteobacteria-3]|nr:MAG: polyketide cyclase / dehydrase and lipid transport [Gammaproteobacteria bacterium HGW-Gammaproteobacteria-3]